MLRDKSGRERGWGGGVFEKRKFPEFHAVTYRINNFANFWNRYPVILWARLHTSSALLLDMFESSPTGESVSQKSGKTANREGGTVVGMCLCVLEKNTKKIRLR